MNKKVLLDSVETALNGMGVAVGLAEIETILGIILLVVNISILVARGIFKLVSWYKGAKEDGKITKEEIDEGIKIIDETKTEIEENVDKKGKKK